MKCVSLAFLTLALWASPGLAGSIDWGTAVNDSLYDASGVPLTEGYQFELGTFPSTFTPTLANVSQWAAQWKRIEPAAFNAINQYVAENSILRTSGANLVWERDATLDEDAPTGNPNVFSPGESVYMWTFNHKAIDSTAQWALVTGRGSTLHTDWELTAAMGAELAELRTWRLSNATDSVIGGLHNAQGPGTYLSNPSAFNLQTALVVPEPGSVLLLGAAALTAWRRRRS